MTLLIKGVLALACWMPYGPDQIEALRGRLDRIRERLEALKPEVQQLGDLGDFSFVEYSGRPIVVLGLAYQSRVRYGNKPDGGIGLTAVFGDPRKVIVQIPILFSDVSKPGHRGAASIRLVKPLGNGFSIAAGVDQIYQWGGTDSYRGTFVRVDKWFSLRTNPNDPMGKLGMQLGVGDGRFAPDGALNRRDAFGNRNPDLKQIGFFGGLTFSLSKECDLVARYLFNDWLVGVTVRPTTRIFATMAVADAFNQVGDNPRLVMAVGYVIPLGGK